MASVERPQASPANADPCQSPDLSHDPHRPFNGAEYGGEPSIDWHSKLRISNGNTEDAAVLIANATAETSDRLIYIRAGMTAAMGRIAPGQYRLTFQLGRDWDARAEGFRCASSTSIFDRLASFEERETDKGVEYSTVEITLHKLAGGNAHTSPVATAAFRRRGKPG